MTLERGALLNKRYRIVEILGQGGMAAVYRAIDENLGVDVAVKENLFTTEEYARQFRREAVILANLRHPNMPRVTDHFVIEQQGQYLVMDYIEGEDLRQRMDRVGTLPDEEVTIIGVALCEALSYLHTRNPVVLHRDIKPGNVKITPSGQIYLVDFGLAKVVSGRQATTTGARAMTPGYSPPEQYGTARTDHRSDIYSLGATMYSALTDVIPEDALARAMDQVILTPLTKRNPKISKRLAACIETAMAVRPDDRYQTAEEFRVDLLNSRSTTRRKLPVELMVSPAPFEEGGEDRLEKAPDSGVGGHSDEVLSFPISSPVKDMPYQPSRRKPVNRGLRRFLLLSLIVSILTLGFVLNPTWASSVSAVFQTAGMMIPALNSSASPTPEETILSSQDTSPVVNPIVEATSTPSPTYTLTPTATLAPTETPTPTITPSPSPSPQPTVTGGGPGQIAFVSDRDGGIPNIFLINIDGTGLTQITDFTEGACQPDWSPDGRRLVFIRPCKGNQQAYTSTSLYIIDADGSNLVPLPIFPGGDYSPTWSSDGSSIAFVSVRNQSIPQIHILDLATNETVRVEPPDQARPETYPSWSPDDSMFVYVSSRNEVKTMNRDGSNRIILARNPGSGINRDSDWSPDGQTVVFNQVSTGNATYLMAVAYSPDGNQAVKVPNSDTMSEPSFSPDSQWIAAVGYITGARDIFIIRISGLDLTQVTDDVFTDFDPAWRPPVQ